MLLLAQNIAAIGLILYQGNSITAKISNRSFFELNHLLPCTSKKEVDMVKWSRDSRHFKGQTKKWQIGVMESWEKFSLALQVWMTMLSELDHELIPQVLALQNMSMQFRAIDPTSEGFTSQSILKSSRLSKFFITNSCQSNGNVNFCCCNNRLSSNFQLSWKRLSPRSLLGR